MALSLTLRRCLVFWLLPLCITATSARDAVPSPKADADLICPSDGTGECYPKVFQATDEFQVVREDQDLPPGLHVRLNIWSGEKEAKLYNPADDSDVPENAPVDRSVVVVDSDRFSEPDLPRNAPKYDAKGMIRAPSVDSPEFVAALAALKEPELNQQRADSSIDAALSTLQELSHDIYYGWKVAGDAGAVKSLFCLMGDVPTDQAPADGALVQRARSAAIVVAAAVRNNPQALEEIGSNWPSLAEKSACPGRSGEAALRDCLFHPVPDSPLDGESESEAMLVKARISALNGLIKSPQVRADFLASGGILSLLQVLREHRAVRGWQAAQQKVGDLLQDNFLDEDMGATLGDWPTSEPSSAELCAGAARDAHEACAEYYVLDLVERYGSDTEHWSLRLLEKMREQKTANIRNKRYRDEL